MTTGVERVVIVGAGACGGRAAEALREAGHEGTITLVGDEIHPPYERPPLSKAAVTGTEPAAPATLFGEGRPADLDVELVCGVAASAIERDARTVMLADGRSLAYDRLLLATGATAPAHRPRGRRGARPAHRGRCRGGSGPARPRRSGRHHRRRVHRARAGRQRGHGVRRDRRSSSLPPSWAASCRPRWPTRWPSATPRPGWCCGAVSASNGSRSAATGSGSS